MFAAQIVFDAASAQVWAGKRISNGAFLRNHAHILRPVDEDLVAGEQAVHLLQGRTKLLQKIAQQRQEFFREIANLAADPGVGGSEARAAQHFTEVVDFFPLSKRMKQNGHRAEAEPDWPSTH